MRIANLDSGLPVVFSNSNGVSFGTSGRSLTASSSFTGVPGVVAVQDSGTTFTSGTLVFSDANGVSWGINGATVTAAVPSAPAPNVQAGSQSVSTGTLVFSNSNNITFGMSGSSRVTASYAGPNLDFWMNVPQYQWQSFGGLPVGAGGFVFFFPLSPSYAMPGRITANTVGFLVSYVSSQSASSSFSSTYNVGIYTVNGSTLSLLNSARSTLALGAAVNNSSSFIGFRWLTFHSSLWSSSPVFSPGVNYIVGINLVTSNFSWPINFFGGGFSNQGPQVSGTIGTSVATALSNGYDPYCGKQTVATSAPPTSFALSALVKMATVNSQNLYGIPTVFLNQNGPSAF
jgi:hypothetical protein